MAICAAVQVTGEHLEAFLVVRRLASFAGHARLSKWLGNDEHSAESLPVP